MVIKKWTNVNKTTVHLPASKSISNRIQIISALSGQKQIIENLSESQDSRDMRLCLASKTKEIFVGEGGTTLRFLLAYYFITQQEKIITAGASLLKRPQRNLFIILERLGATFEYLGKEPYHLPVRLIPSSVQNKINYVEMDGSISSQFISAIMMIAPYLDEGLIIQLTDHVVSKPYIQMTAKLMNEFNINVKYADDKIIIPRGQYAMKDYHVESDWSAATFFYCYLALAEKGELYFPNLHISHLQGDESISTIMREFGIVTEDDSNGIRIRKNTNKVVQTIAIDFNDCPDLFPALAVFCAIKNCNLSAFNVQHLEHKESNRLLNILEIIEQCNSQYKIKELNNAKHVEIDNHKFSLAVTKFDPIADHRLAMAYSLFSKLAEIEIINPEVVDKSFPGFWEQVERMGVSVEAKL